jgi:hypothetical protein
LTTPTETTERTPPEGYKEVLYWRISENKVALILVQVFAVLLTLIWGVLFYLAALRLGSIHLSVPDSTWLLLLAYLGVLPIHEVIHGAAMRIFGAKPKYGVMWKELMFYATSPGHAFSRNQFLAVTYAPFVLITVAVVVLLAVLHPSIWVWAIIAAGAGNAGGAIGDMWISTVVLKYPANAKIMDEKDGVRVFVPEEISPV